METSPACSYTNTIIVAENVNGLTDLEEENVQRQSRKETEENRSLPSNCFDLPSQPLSQPDGVPLLSNLLVIPEAFFQIVKGEGGMSKAAWGNNG
ncbi:hypothetical protein V6N11_080057 [Hibiscus sabdariffa]|uniref:Uncharacterized protein n=1 Tax=Hibiscus sabdariffa TaxID=183260 RepID=A0ABR2RXJ7_9ROSI